MRKSEIGGIGMITLRACSGKEFVLNCDLIYKIEEEFDTIITLTDQKTLRVEDRPEEIIEKVKQFKQEVYCKGPIVEVEKR